MSPVKPTGSRRETSAITRRRALGLLAAQMTLSLGACGKPAEQIVPYVRLPEGLVPGDPLRFATVLPLGGYGRGVICLSIDGHPFKIEGNTAHPASLGSTDIFAEAAILPLYDPDRARTPTRAGMIASWDAFMTELVPAMERLSRTQGQGLRLLTSRVTSPTLLRQIDELLVKYPHAAWHAYDPVDCEASRDGARLAFGRPLDFRPRLDASAVVLALDADFLGAGPAQISNARAWAGFRNAQAPSSFSRVYAVESCPTATGVKADNRLARSPHAIGKIAVAIANALGAALPDQPLDEAARRFAASAAADLQAHRGKALVLAGPTLPPDMHALVYWINHSLQAPAGFIEPFDRANGRQPGTLSDLASELESHTVDTLFVLGANPAYDAPAGLRIADWLHEVSLSVSLGMHADETAALCRWHIPQCHPLESWSDLRSHDGTAAIMQPLIRPLHASRTDHELLAALAGSPNAAPRDLVRATWRSTGGANFESWWHQSLSVGVIAGTAAPPAVSLAAPKLTAPAVSESSPMTLVFRPDPTTWDGGMANNPWLQECPKPLSKEVWGSALTIGAEDAKRLYLKTSDVVRLSVGNESVEGPVRVELGMAEGVVGVTLGNGRTKAGAIGNGVGSNAYTVLKRDFFPVVEGAKIARTGRTQAILTTSSYVRLDGTADQLYPQTTLDAIADGTAPENQSGPLPSLLPTEDHDTYAWAMSIDTSVCIGCNACVVACQSENNGAVVGPEEIARGRDMHWLRVDIYDSGTPQAPRAGFQPVPCMHCEHAPCEPVCPVAASVHDSEGLNVQVYNRCVGTRFCEANCPYKVRRFNFFGYADGQEYANLGAESMKALRNPDVSTRQRGVMEKCTYCIQRISGARREAKKDNRRIAEGEVITACQSACPTRAITFGDLTRPQSGVAKRRRDPRHYELLGHLDTRPRTTYLANVRNPNRTIDKGPT
jgi:Fe-S-cluster-containing dehydrogenase component